METTTFKCKKCGWIGNPPRMFRVNCGLSSWPVRDICPECVKQSRGEHTVAIDRIVPKPEFYEITDDDRIFYIDEALELLNFPKGLDHFFMNHCLVNLDDVPREFRNGFRVWSKVRKRELDLLIKRVNEPGPEKQE